MQVATTRWTCSSRKPYLSIQFFRRYVVSPRRHESVSAIHAHLPARHRKHEADDEKWHQLMELNIQAASDHAVLELSFSMNAPRAPRLKLRQRLDFSTRFPSACTHSTRTTTRTARTHAHTQRLNFRRTAWRQPRTLRCSLGPFLSCRLKRRPLRSLNLALLWFKNMEVSGLCIGTQGQGLRHGARPGTNRPRRCLCL